MRWGTPTAGFPSRGYPPVRPSATPRPPRVADHRGAGLAVLLTTLGGMAVSLAGGLSAVSPAAAARPGPPSEADPAAAVPAAPPRGGERAGQAPPGGTPSGAPAAEEFAALRPLRRDAELERRLSVLAVDPRLRVGLFVLDPVSGRYASVRGEQSFAAASVIKVPLAVELLRRAEAGEIPLDEVLVLRHRHMAAGSGDLQYLGPGLKLTVRRTAELMIRKSDNTATNMIVERLGGIDAVNAAFRDLGLRETTVRTPLPDMEGTNRISPRDLVSLLARVRSGGILRSSGRDLLFSWMRRSHVKSLLPAGVGRGAVCYNKTGDIPGALGDAGVIVLPGGEAYVASVQIERPRNSRRAHEMIRRLSRAAYERLRS